MIRHSSSQWRNGNIEHFSLPFAYSLRLVGAIFYFFHNSDIKVEQCRSQATSEEGLLIYDNQLNGAGMECLIKLVLSLS